MQTTGEMDKLASAFVAGDVNAWYSAADMQAATGLDDSHLYRLLARMHLRGWISVELTDIGPNPGLRWFLTNRGWDELAPE